MVRKCCGHGGGVGGKGRWRGRGGIEKGGEREEREAQRRRIEEKKDKEEGIGMDKDGGS